MYAKTHKNMPERMVSPKMQQEPIANPAFPPHRYAYMSPNSPYMDTYSFKCGAAQFLPSFKFWGKIVSLRMGKCLYGGQVTLNQ